MRITDLSPNWRGTRGYQPPTSGGQRSLVRDLAEQRADGPTSTVRPSDSWPAVPALFTVRQIYSPKLGLPAQIWTTVQTKMFPHQHWSVRDSELSLVTIMETARTQEINSDLHDKINKTLLMGHNYGVGVAPMVWGVPPSTFPPLTSSITPLPLSPLSPLSPFLPSWCLQSLILQSQANILAHQLNINVQRQQQTSNNSPGK